ncbi:hypothetical protein OG739_12055 [Streptomyces longwoodensis]|uniref:hypothetical protein n=1 Tax=Streptomyces longwoodensis TaxID=68231 RepID=UPI003253F41C
MTDLTPGGADERRTQQTDGVTEAQRVREAKRAHETYQDDRAAAEAARQDPTGHGASGLDTGTSTLDAGTTHTTGAAGTTAAAGTTGTTGTAGTTGTTGATGTTGTTGTYATVVPDATTGTTGTSGTTGTTGTTGTHDTGTTGVFAKPATTGATTTGTPTPDTSGSEGHGVAADAPSLLSRDASDELAGRLRQTVVEFVDRPKEAVEEADRLLEELANRFTEAVTERRRTLRGAWHTDDTGKRGAGSTTDTEQLRLALRDYRELAERLLHV